MAVKLSSGRKTISAPRSTKVQTHAEKGLLVQMERRKGLATLKLMQVTRY